MSSTTFYRWTRHAVKLLLSCVLLVPVAVATTAAPEAVATRANLSERDIQCLARNAYYEARGEPIKGVIGVIAVTMNRMQHPDFPSQACEVVHQKRKSTCQFSWYCNSKLSPPNSVILNRFKLLVMEYNYYLHDDPTHGSLYFHTKAIASRSVRPVASIHNHVFFRELR